MSDPQLPDPRAAEPEVPPPGPSESFPAALRELFRPPRRGRAIGVLIVLALAGFALWYIGMDGWHAIAIAIGIAAIALSWIAVPDLDRSDWPREKEGEAEGSRREVQRLAWSLQTRRGRVQIAALRRVRDLARDRLARRGLALDDPADRPAVERLLGAPAYAVLRPGNLRPPTRRALLRCLDAVEGLDSVSSDRPKGTS